MVAVNLRLFGDVLALSLERAEGITVVHHGAMGGADAVDAFHRTRPDIALLDYTLVGLDGPEATAAIRRSSPSAKVLLMAGTFAAQDVERALAAGAVGFLPKGVSLSHVVDSVRQAHQGRPLVYADELARLVDQLNARARYGDDLLARCATLSDRELEVLRWLSEGKTTAQVAAAMALSVGTIKNTLTQIFAKTGASTRLEAVDMARMTGVLGRPPGGGAG